MEPGQDWISEGRKWHESGDYEQAFQCYREAFLENPASGEAKNLIGLLMHHAGANEQALEWMRQAIASDASNALYHNHLGLIYRSMGSLEQAAAAYRRAVELDPGDADCWYNLGNLHKDLNNSDAAVLCFERSLALKPDAGDALYNLGVVHMERRDWHRADACFRRALKTRPDWPALHAYLARVLKNKGDKAGMIEHCRRAYDLCPREPAVLIELGVLYLHLTRIDGADASSGEVESGQIVVPANEGNGQHDSARTNSQRAESCLRAALELKPDSSEACNDLGVLLQTRGLYDETLGCFEKAIRFQHDFAEARMNRGMILLLRGRYSEGWEEYEWRWKWDAFGYVERPLESRWMGEDIRGKTILAYAEQGLGDTLFFVRYLFALSQKAKKVILECQPPLRRLLAGLKGVSAVCCPGDVIPDFDCHIPLGSLPKMLGATPQSPPCDSPYLRKTAGARVAIPSTALNQFKVGIAWAGNPKFLDDFNRSIAVEELRPLFSFSGIAWFNLQIGDKKGELNALRSTGQWHDLTEQLHDFADTAALVDQLDLVITVDTSVAHLAGAMGKPVWTLLPFVPDWRWQLDRQDTPWYPSMLLFRKTRAGEKWRCVVDRVANLLRAKVDPSTNAVAPVTLNPASADACWQQAAACMQNGRQEEAVAALLNVAQLDPRRKGVHMALGAILKNSGQLEDSLEHCRKEVEIDPGNPDAHLNLALVLLALDRFHEAIEVALNVVELKPDSAEAWLRMGIAWVQVNDLDRAVLCFERAVEIDPPNPEPHWHLSTALLARGDFERGWREHEWRWLMPDFTTPRARFSKPVWDGGDPRGKTILLHAEQGAGDTIQFVRYAALMERMGAVVLVGCAKELVPLIRTATGVSRAESSLSELPEFDYHAPIMGLPRLMRTDLQSIPCEIPYLFADAKNPVLPPARPGFKRVGLVWAGNPNHNHDRRRTIPARLLIPLLAESGIEFFSLQVGGKSQELAGVPGAESLVDLSPLLSDYGATAAVIAQLDLVISVDTATAHLAGALGRPVWLLLHNPGEWRWFVDREDSPWYSTMRLFRQAGPGDWDAVVARVRTALRQWAGDALDRDGADKQQADEFRDRGIASHKKGQLGEAVLWFEKAAASNSLSAEHRFNLGLALHHAGRLGEAAGQLRIAARMAPGEPRMLMSLGCVLQDMGRHEESLQWFDAALELKPDYAEAHNNRGACLQARGMLTDAMDAYREALRLQPEYVDAHLNMATVLRESGRVAESIAWHRKLALLCPNSAENQSNLGFALLLDGQFEEGWRQYEWRLQTKGRAGRDKPPKQPRWEGEPLEGRTILLRTEQGMGDSIQFIRYASLAARAGGKVIVECPETLCRLFATVAGVQTVIASGKPLPQFDVYAPLPSLPMLFHTDLDNIPQRVPYLRAESPPREAKPESSVHAGLVWAGNPEHKNDRNRSVSIRQLERLFAIDGVIWHNLQCGSKAAEWPDLPGKTVCDSAAFVDFYDTAVAIGKLDLVIAVDTSVAHLAGALGANTWLMLPFAPDWRWLLGRSDSPWYPTMRLFRQPALGDWATVISHISRELGALCESRRIRSASLSMGAAEC